MPRIAKADQPTPPEFITSPSLGALIETELRELANRIEEDTTEAGEELAVMDAIRVQTLRTAADQLKAFHSPVALRSTVDQAPASNGRSW